MYYKLGDNFAKGSTITSKILVHENLGQLLKVSLQAGGPDAWQPVDWMVVKSPFYSPNFPGQWSYFKVGMFLDDLPRTQEYVSEHYGATAQYGEMVTLAAYVNPEAAAVTRVPTPIPFKWGFREGYRAEHGRAWPLSLSASPTPAPFTKPPTHHPSASPTESPTYDPDAPRIVVTGELEVQLTWAPNHVYHMPALTCTSDRDGALLVDVHDQNGIPITNNVIDMGKLATYVFVYTCHDLAGYSAKPITKHVYVHEVTSAPTPFPCQPPASCCNTTHADCMSCKACMSKDDYCASTFAYATTVAEGVAEGCTRAPTRYPTAMPTADPTDSPTGFPTAAPTKAPTSSPSIWGGRITEPTVFPTKAPVPHTDMYARLVADGFNSSHNGVDSAHALVTQNTGIDATAAPTKAPTGPPTVDANENTCMNGPNTVQSGWSGAGHGWNFCNKCYCDHGILSCNTLTCVKPKELGSPCDHLTCSYEFNTNLHLVVMKVHHNSSETVGGTHHCYFHQADQDCKCECYGAKNVLWHSYKDWHDATNNGVTEVPYHITYKFTHLVNQPFATSHLSGTSWNIGSEWTGGNKPLPCSRIDVDAPLVVDTRHMVEKMTITASKVTIKGGGYLDLLDTQQRGCCNRLGPQFVQKADMCEALNGAPVRGQFAN
jgi:hypothetical protein